MKKIVKGIVSLAMAAAMCVPTVLPDVSDVSQFSDTSLVQMMDANAASYRTGNYKVNTSSGLNVRNRANTSGSKLGAATNGTQFNVTKVSGNWGYGTIRCTNGTKTGWVCLDYCRYMGETYSTPLSNGSSYFISPACATGSVLDTYQKGKKNGTNIHLWSKHSDKDQQFKAVLKSNGYYAFYNMNANNKVLDVTGGKVGNGTNIQLYDYNGTDSQLWRLIDAGNGYYYLQSKLNSSYYLDVSGASSGNGTNIQLYKGNSSNAQKFRFTKVNTSDNNNNSNNKTRIANFQNSYNYAKKYWNTRNRNYNYYSGRNCANFVSQCLVAGGIPTNSTWKNTSYAFVNCTGLKNYFVNNYKVTYKSNPSASNIKAGDVIYTNGGSHVMFVMKVSGNTVYASGNTNNRDCIAMSTRSICGVLQTSKLF